MTNRLYLQVSDKSMIHGAHDNKLIKLQDHSNKQKNGAEDDLILPCSF